MDETVVCLGCGGVVGKTDASGCHCPPPVMVSASAHPHRSAPTTDLCARCGGRLVDQRYHDVACPTCVVCGGVFLPREVVVRLERVDEAALRVAFPRHEAAPERSARYLPCLVCKKLMNRTIFARVSGILVDVCEEHGVWFDAGEIGKAIAFLEAGGSERSRAFEERERADAYRREWEKRREPVHTGE